MDASNGEVGEDTVGFVTPEIDYPYRELHRLTTAFRLFTLIPTRDHPGLVSVPQTRGSDAHRALVMASSGLVFVPTVLMLLF